MAVDLRLTKPKVCRNAKKPRESGAFVATALPVNTLNFVKRGEADVYGWLVVGTFGAGNVIISAIFIGTVWLLARGKLFSVPPSIT